jgi:hypothetical protein
MSGIGWQGSVLNGPMYCVSSIGCRKSSPARMPTVPREPRLNDRDPVDFAHRMNDSFVVIPGQCLVGFIDDSSFRPTAGMRPLPRGLTRSTLLPGSKQSLVRLSIVCFTIRYRDVTSYRTCVGQFPRGTGVIAVAIDDATQAMGAAACARL